jgi:hypothetical protein
MRFREKLKLVNFIVLRAGYPTETASWSEIYKELNNHRGVRNLIPHQRRLMSQNPDAPEIEVSLEPLFYKSGGKGLRTDEIRATADELEKVNGRLSIFIRGLNNPR